LVLLEVGQGDADGAFGPAAHRQRTGALLTRDMVFRHHFGDFRKAARNCVCMSARLAASYFHWIQ
jgi:hypothetical protein